MKTVWKLWGAMLALAVVALVVWLVAAHVWGPLDRLPFVQVDDESVTIGGLHAVDGVLAIAGVLVALLVVVTVVPLVVALALAIAACGVAVGIAAAVFGVLMPLSPFLLIGWLIWRATRKPGSPRTPSAPAPDANAPPAATMAG
ncbi:MAG TPA: hypothetical protein VJN68_06970 [Burkholderiaceae bacterium]|nr:hypothetical protein [Burkholderiaceae bacterium]